MTDPRDKLIEELKTELAGIVHFADGFSYWNTPGPIGAQFRAFIAGGKRLLERIEKEPDRG